MTFLNTLRISLLLALSVSCVDIQSPDLESLKPSDVLAEVNIRSAAIMIEQGDSHQIAFDLISVSEERIPLDQHAIKWTSSESNVVSVSGSGIVYGHAVSSSPIFVAVEYEHNYVTMFDTVRVYVTDGRIDADGIKLISLDSNRVGGPGKMGAPRVRVDLYKGDSLIQKGSVIPIEVDPPAEFRVDGAGGPDLEPVYRITNQKILLGGFWIRASLNLYGNEVEDSIRFTGLYNESANGMLFSGIPVNPRPIPELDTVPLRIYQPCAILWITNFSTIPIDVIFSDSTASSTGCASAPANAVPATTLFIGDFIGGNVINIPPMGGQAWRRSNTSGVIRYTVRNSATKEIIPWEIYHMKQVDIQD